MNFVFHRIDMAAMIEIFCYEMKLHLPYMLLFLSIYLFVYILPAGSHISQFPVLWKHEQRTCPFLVQICVVPQLPESNKCLTVFRKLHYLQSTCLRIIGCFLTIILQSKHHSFAGSEIVCFYSCIIVNYRFFHTTSPRFFICLPMFLPVFFWMAM